MRSVTDVRLMNGRTSLASVIVGSSEVANNLRLAVQRAADCDAKVLITRKTGDIVRWAALAPNRFGSLDGGPDRARPHLTSD
jgi:nicotinate-nucleotide pyrophosphorylase